MLSVCLWCVFANLNHLSDTSACDLIFSASSCDQEQQSAQEEARQHKNDAVFVPDCAQGGLYKPVQCHPSTGYCWCVLVDTGRPIPGTSTRWEIWPFWGGFIYGIFTLTYKDSWNLLLHSVWQTNQTVVTQSRSVIIAEGSVGTESVQLDNPA